MSESFDGFKLALIVEYNAKTAAYAVTQIETGKDSRREADRASVPGRGVNICGNALIELDPLIRADADIHNNLLHWRSVRQFKQQVVQTGDIGPGVRELLTAGQGGLVQDNR